MRMMLAKIFAVLRGAEINDFVDDAKWVIAEGKKIRITFDHEDSYFYSSKLSAGKKRYRNKKVIFLCRDPRDIVVSWYFHRTAKGSQFDISGFIRDERYGIDKIINYMNIWEDNRDVPSGFLCISYEKLIENPALQLRRLLDFIGIINIREEIISDAVEYCRFDKMKKMESNNTFNSPEIPSLTDAKNKEAYRTRRGKVGGYSDYLNQDDICYLNEKIRDNLSDWYGYNETGAS